MPVASDTSAPLYARLSAAPLAHDPVSAAARLDDLQAEALEAGDAARLAALIERPDVQALLSGIAGCSPYLTGLMRRDSARLVRVLDHPPAAHLANLSRDLRDALAPVTETAEAMRLLRRYKAEIALLVALADLGGVWQVPDVTAALSAAADTATAGAVRFLFRQATARGDWLADDPTRPDIGSGYIVIAMGKHGACELNYSSDIDLIVFFDPARARVKPGLDPPTFFVRLTRDLVRLLQERTADGYVFRTDLRLRPDPGATQVAISIPAAHIYYESYGQNWERAALIKARPVAGDIAAGHAFLGALTPFIWRKYLDFAAIADIHAMKRQINSFRGFGNIGVAGHNIKLGRGGIREIEFFVQTQQLIAGGRQPDLRTPATLAALAQLVTRGWIKPAVRADLAASYLFLREIEHRLQMLADEQTQTLPREAADLERLANFCGFASTEAFGAALTGQLETVQNHYAALFETMPELTRSGANMVFAGEADDPATLEALAAMGFARPSDVIAAIRGWHHGRFPAVRSPRARELLTEVQPLLVEALGATADPDQAFLSFDRFLAELPSGVQLFSLLRANPSLLRLVAEIMGSAPRLARLLGRRRSLLDAVLDPGFFGKLPEGGDLDKLIAEEIDASGDLQLALDRARVVGSEQRFLIGVRVLSGTIPASQAGFAFAETAERLIAALQARVAGDLVHQHGTVPGGAAAVIAMGKLGGREMTAASDLDLILVYDFEPESQSDRQSDGQSGAQSGAQSGSMSDGPKPLPPTQYYARFTQRLISALSVATAEGALYEVDMRLRPSGQKGPVATQLSGFIDYQANEAWTWEHLALTRARVITGPPGLRAKVEAAIRQALVRPRHWEKIAADVRQMRALIAKEKGTTDIWDLKQVRGGLVDIEFMAQFLQLVHAAAEPGVLDWNTVHALRNLTRLRALAQPDADILIPAAELLNGLTQVLRLCLDGPFDPARAPDGLKNLLARAGDVPDFAQLEAVLRQTLADVASLFDRIVA